MKKNYFDVSKIELFILRIIRKKCIELLQYRTRVFQSSQRDTWKPFPHNSD